MNLAVSSSPGRCTQPRPNAGRATKRSTTSGACPATPTRPCRPCSTSSSRRSTTCRKARSATSACAATRRWRRAWACRERRRCGTCRRWPAKASRASPATACVKCTAKPTASGASSRATSTPRCTAPSAATAWRRGRAKDQFKVKTSPDETGPGHDMHAAGVLLPAALAQRVLHVVPPGGRVPGHQARSGVGAVPRVAGVQEGHPVPGLPHGPHPRPADRLRVRPRGEDQQQDRQRQPQELEPRVLRPELLDRPPGRVSVPPEGQPLDDARVADVRLACRLGHQRVRRRRRRRHRSTSRFRPCGPRPTTAATPARSSTTTSRSATSRTSLRVAGDGKRLARRRAVLRRRSCAGRSCSSHYVVTNTNEGHNLLTASLGAQPQLWANVVLIGPAATALWETGYPDSLRRPGRHPLRRRPQQAAAVRLAVVQPADDVPDHRRQGNRPRVLPAGEHRHRPAAVHPPGAAADVGASTTRRSSAWKPVAGAARLAPRAVQGSRASCCASRAVTGLSFRMRSRTEPMYFMRFCESTAEMQRAMNEGMIDFHQSSVEFDVR